MRRIFGDYAHYKKQPDYYISDNGVIVTLFNRNYDGQSDGQKISANNRLERIIRYIESDNAMTADRLKELLNVSKRTVERDIEKLRKDNKIEYVGSAKDGRWIVKTKN
nr:HTH domain-containing protein [uncultured Treponema sp.]